MTDRAEDVLREARGDYIVGMRSQGYRATTVARLIADYDAAVSDLITERDRLRTAAGVFLSVVTLENPHRYETTPAERMLRAALDEPSHGYHEAGDYP